MAKAVPRIVTIHIAESVAKRIEELTDKPIEDVTLELVNGFLKDKRRTLENFKSLGVAWPTDWYQRALLLWGERHIADRVRLLVYESLRSDHKLKLSPIPDFRQYAAVHVDREVSPNPGRQSTIQTTLIPQDWYDRLLEKYGDGNVSTFVKSLIYTALESESGPKDEPLSIPPRLSKYL